jgi:hypothetical protein
MAKPRLIKPGTYALVAYIGLSTTGSSLYLHETYVHDRPDAGIKEATARLGELGKNAAEMNSTTSFGALIDEWMRHSSTVGRRSPTTIAVMPAGCPSSRPLPVPFRWRRSPPRCSTIGTTRCWRLATPRPTSRRSTAWCRPCSSRARSGSPPTEPWPAARPRSASPSMMSRRRPPDRVETLIRLAEESRSAEMADLIHWAAIPGMRRGEICGLHRSRVDWEAARVDVCRSVCKDNRTIKEKDTKTHLNRWVPVGQTGLAILKTRQIRALARAEAAGVTLDPDGYVWPTDEAGRTPISAGLGTIGRRNGTTDATPAQVDSRRSPNRRRHDAMAQRRCARRRPTCRESRPRGPGWRAPSGVRPRVRRRRRSSSFPASDLGGSRSFTITGLASPPVRFATLRRITAKPSKDKSPPVLSGPCIRLSWEPGDLGLEFANLRIPAAHLSFEPEKLGLVIPRREPSCLGEARTTALAHEPPAMHATGAHSVTFTPRHTGSLAVVGEFAWLIPPTTDPLTDHSLSDSDNRLVEVGAAFGTIEHSIPVGEDSTVGCHQQIAQTRRRGLDTHDGLIEVRSAL